MADIILDTNASNVQNRSGGFRTTAWADADNGIVILADDDESLHYFNTTDGGATWNGPTSIDAGQVFRYDIWADWWTSGDTGTTIHIVYMNIDSDEFYYRPLSMATPASPSLGTEVTISTGTAYDGAFNRLENYECSITKSRGGNLYAYENNSAPIQNFWRSTDGGTNWTSRSNTSFLETADDHCLLFPANLADSDDIWALYWDTSADELSLKTYDNSADSWSEASIATSMVDDVQNYLQMSGSVRHSDGHLLVAAWDDFDPATATANLKTWDITDAGTITAKTNVLSNVNEAAQCTVTINQQNDDVYIGYIKGTTLTSLVDIHYKKSTDGMANWGTETQYNEDTNDDHRAVWSDISIGDSGGQFQLVWFNSDGGGDLISGTTNSIEIAAAAGGSSVSQTWNIRNDISSYVSQNWSIRNDISQHVSQTWNLRNDVSEYASQTWNIRNDIASYISQTWNLRNDISSFVSQVWNIRNDISNYVSRIWNIRNDISQYVSQIWNLRHDITTTGGSSVSQTWNIRNDISSYISQNWNIRNNISNYVSNIWNIRNDILNYVNQTWNIRNDILNYVNQTWNIRNNISNFVSNVWNIRNDISSFVSQVWNLRHDINGDTPPTPIVISTLKIKGKISSIIKILGKQDRVIKING